MRKNKLIAFVCFSCFCFVPLGVNAQTDPSQQSKPKFEVVVNAKELVKQFLELEYNKDLRDELEVVDSQMKKFKELIENHYGKMQDGSPKGNALFQQYKTLTRQGDERAAQEVLNRSYRENQRHARAQGDSLLEHINDIFLPHQLQRLRQVILQRKLGWDVNGYLAMPFAVRSKLDLDSQQNERLEKTTRRVIEEFGKEVAMLRKRKMDEVLSVLSPQDREKIRELVGDFYDHKKAIKAHEQSDDE